MPQLPPELVALVGQLPITVLALATGWVVLRWEERRHAAELSREKARYDELRADKERAEAAVRADADRRGADAQAEITRLRARITRLENMLDGSRGRGPEDEA